MKPDFFVTRATSKTFKIFWLIHNHFSPEGHLTFMDNPIIRIATKFQYKLPLLRTLVVTGTQSHGLEVVHIEKVLLPYKALEAGGLQFMWTLSPPSLEKRVLKTVQWNVYLFLLLLLLLNVIFMVTLLLLLSSMMILIMGPYLSSDNPFQVHYIKCNSLLLHCAMVCCYKLLHLFK